MENIFNIIISGTGGQGVFALSNVIRSLCVRNGFQCQGATFKGGAQRLGSIHTELRIVFENNSASALFSSQIPKGSVHLLIGLEPWETLRFANYCNKETVVVCNNAVQPLYVERFKSEKLFDPVKELSRVFVNLKLSNFTLSSVKEYGNEKMLNFLMLKYIIGQNILPFNWEQAEEEFLKLINRAK